MSELNDQMKARLDKLAKLREMGINPYPYAYKRTHDIASVLREFDGLEKSQEKIKIRGRLIAFRRQGKTAFANLKKICEEYLEGRYQIQVVDLLKNPQLASGDQILAIPTLVRRLPKPIRKIIGDLSNTERVLIGLDLVPRK